MPDVADRPAGPNPRRTPPPSQSAVDTDVCTPEWNARHAINRRQTYQGTAEDPEAAMREVTDRLVAAGGAITRQREASGMFELDVVLREELDVKAMLEEVGVALTQDERVENHVVLDDPCDRLVSAQRVARRLESWLAEDLPTQDKTFILQMYQQHLNQVNRLAQQMENFKKNGDGAQISVKIAPLGTDPGRRR